MGRPKEGEWHIRGTPRRPVGKEIKSQRKQEAKLWNPLFITKVPGLCGTFVQVKERCLLRAAMPKGAWLG